MIIGRLRRWPCALTALGLAVASAFPAQAQTQTQTQTQTEPPPEGTSATAPSAVGEAVITGTGGLTGLYFPVAGAIARVAEMSDDPNLPRIHVESTGGSMENLVRLGLNDLTFGIARSDVQHNAYFGQGRFTGIGADDTLRTVLTLHAEPLVVIARADAGISELADLPGHRINLGPDGTDTRLLLEVVLAAAGWDVDTAFAAVLEVPFADQVDALCSGQADVIAVIAGQPSGTVFRALDACPTVLIPLEGPAMTALLSGNAALAQATIPSAYYPTIQEDVITLGPVATLTTTSAIDSELVETLVAVTLDNIAALRGLHPALKDVTAESMARVGASAPFHDGALQAFRDRGLIQPDP